MYKLEVFKDSIKEPLNIQMSNLLKVCLERYFLNELFVSEANQQMFLLEKCNTFDRLLS